MAGLALLGLYSAAVTAAAVLVSRKRAGDEGFFINSRSSSAWLVGFSIVVSCVGASATVGAAGLAFKVGTPAFWWLGSGAAGLVVLAVFLAGRVRRSRARTMPELVENFFGPNLRRLISVIIVLAWLAILAAQFSALGRVVTALTGLGPWPAMTWSVLLITGHTMLSGQAGVIRLDRWQCLALVTGLALMTAWLLRFNFPALAEVRIEAVNPLFPPGRLIYFLLIMGGSYVVCPMLFGRLLSAESERAARRGALGAAAGLAAVSAVVVLAGLLSRGLVSPETPGDAVLVTVLDNVFPAWLTLAVQVMLVSAIVSSADSCLITAGLVLSYDVLKRPEVKIARYGMIGLALGGLVLTLTGRGILDFLLMANDIYVCGVVGPVFVGLLLAGGREARRGTAAAGIIAGGLLGLASAVTGQAGFSYAGLALSSMLTVLSLAPRRPHYY